MHVDSLMAYLGRSFEHAAKVVCRKTAKKTKPECRHRYPARRPWQDGCFVHELVIEDSPDLPPLWEAFGAFKRPDGHWVLPALSLELASPDAALHIGPQRVALETAASTSRGQWRQGRDVRRGDLRDRRLTVGTRLSV
jgi:hypothetical protein